MITREMVTGTGKGNPPRATIDFETRSVVNLPKTGPWRYATDPSTQPLCMSYRLPFWPQGVVKTWIPDIYREFGIVGTKPPTELFDWIAAGGLVEAHNAMMEKAVWRGIMIKEYLWPDIPRSQWRCSSAKASSYGLPRSLEKACIVMRLKVQKDKEGHKLMMKLCKPRKATKKNPVIGWNGTRDEFLRLFKYCESDVLAEEAFSHSLLDLIPLEQELWKIDQDINEHGLPIDRSFVEAAIAHLNNLRDSANAEINRRTNGQVPKATNRAALLEWLEGQGLELDNTQAATFDALIAMPDDIPEHVLAVIKLVRRAGRASVAKYAAIMERLTAGDRVRDMLVYAGASRTSRWSGAGFQPQNLPRGSIKDMEATIERIMASDEITDLETEFQIEGEDAVDLFQLFSEALRGAIVPDPGKELVSADYNAIEARGLFWVCNHQRGLDIFRDKERDIYLDMAEDIYGKNFLSGKTLKEAKKLFGPERQVGKVGILGCGYGLGKNKMVDYGNKAFASAKVDLVMDIDFADRVVTGYRTKHKPVVDFWYACERAAIEAMLNPGQTIWVNDKIAYKRANRFLFCRLPSGRLIPYPYPELRQEPSPFREGEMKTVLTYEEVNSVTKKWERTKTYGGKLVENIVQALCRDLMGYAMWSVYKHTKYQILLTVHDELVAQCPIGMGDVKEFEDIMCILPKWADGFPITAEGWKGLRYRK